MDDRLPYYMAYPMPLLYDDDRIARRDLDYMKSLYPAAAKRLIPYIEEECDRLEYEGSMMYDESGRMAEGSDSGDGISGIMQQAKRIQEFQKKILLMKERGQTLG